MSDINHQGASCRPGQGGNPAQRRVSSGQEPLVQQPDDKPVVENPGLRYMPEGEIGQQHSGEARLMPESPGGEAEQAGRRMEAVPAGEPARGGPAVPAGPQQPARSLRSAGGGESYLRLLLHVEDGEVSVQGVSEVAGPLGSPEPLHGGLAYEVSVGARPLAAGAVPDPGVRRSFPPQDPGAAGVEGHFIVETASYDFTARVPAAQLSSASLPDMQVAVYRLDGGQVVQPAGDRLLVDHAGHLADEVARLSGIRVEELPVTVRAAFDRVLP
jgi:hypothetical protein